MERIQERCNAVLPCFIVHFYIRVRAMPDQKGDQLFPIFITFDGKENDRFLFRPGNAVGICAILQEEFRKTAIAGVGTLTQVIAMAGVEPGAGIQQVSQGAQLARMRFNFSMGIVQYVFQQLLVVQLIGMCLQQGLELSNFSFLKGVKKFIQDRIEVGRFVGLAGVLEDQTGSRQREQDDDQCGCAQKPYRKEQIPEPVSGQELKCDQAGQGCEDQDDHGPAHTPRGWIRTGSGLNQQHGQKDEQSGDGEVTQDG